MGQSQWAGASAGCPGACRSAGVPDTSCGVVAEAPSRAVPAWCTGGSQWLAVLIARQAVSLAGVCGHQMWCGAESSGVGWPPWCAACGLRLGKRELADWMRVQALQVRLGSAHQMWCGGWWPRPPLASSVAPPLRRRLPPRGPAGASGTGRSDGSAGPAGPLGLGTPDVVCRSGCPMARPHPASAAAASAVLPCCRRQRVVGRCGRDNVPPCSSSASSSMDGLASRP